MSQATLVVAAAEANRQFSRLLRAAREGCRITITSHGEPVAELGPVEAGSKGRESARLGDSLAALEAHWATLTPVVVGAWTRDQLYARDQA